MNTYQEHRQDKATEVLLLERVKDAVLLCQDFVL